MKITLAPDLEKALLRAIAEGVCNPDIVNPEELSKKAKIIHASIMYLLKRKATPPFKPTSIMLTANSLFGISKEAVESYLRTFTGLETGEEIKTILKAARDKTLLVGLINEAGSQLASGDLEVNSLTQLLDKGDYGGESIRALSHSVKDKFPKPPSGLPIGSLPRVSEITRGLYGIWIIGGEPGSGKSTLTWQIALDIAKNINVAYYDLDGTGRVWFIDRTREIVRGNIELFRKLTKRLYFREDIGTLEEDLNFIKPPALLVIDSAQTLPTSLKFSKQSLDAWVRRFKNLTKRGYALLVVSEKARSEYGEANLKGFKGSGDIEYGGTMCAHLLQNEGEDEEDPIKFIIVKNRHGKRKGHIVNLERDEKRIFWFKEENPIE